MPSDCELFDAGGHYAPDFNRLTIFGCDVGESRVARFELELALSLEQALDGEFAIDDRNNNVFVPWLDGTVHHHDVSVKDSVFDHRDATGTQEVSGLWVGHQDLGQIYALGAKVFGGRREAGTDLVAQQRDQQRCVRQGNRRVKVENLGLHE